MATGGHFWKSSGERSATLPGYAIAMSGYGMNADRSKSKAAGYSQHILKPFKASELQAMLAEAARELDTTNPAN